MNKRNYFLQNDTKTCVSICVIVEKKSRLSKFVHWHWIICSIKLGCISGVFRNL